MIGVIGALLGTTAIFIGLPYLAPVFLQEPLKNDPDWERKPAVLVEVQKGRSKLIIRGGKSNALTVIRGNDDKPYILPDDPEWLKSYKQYVWDKAGLHVIVPFLDRVYSYGLTRYEVENGEGKDAGRKIFKPVVDRSDHVRTDPVTWYMNFAGVETETVAITVKASAQIRIVSGMEEQALFGTDAWHILLDQATNRVARGVCRSQATIDKILGRVGSDISKTKRSSTRDYNKINQAILDGVRNYTIEKSVTDAKGKIVLNADGTEKKEKLKLIDFGIDVMSFDIIDFEPEVTEEELKSLRSAAIAMQTARAAVLEAQGKAEATRLQGEAEAEVRKLIGAADAEAKKKIAEALALNPEMADTQLTADALVAMTKDGKLDAALAAFVNKLVKGA